MISTKQIEQECQEVLTKLDSYMDGELTAGNNLELVEHLGRCPQCAQEAEHRRNSRRRLLLAVRNVPVPVGLKDRVRGRLQEARQPHPRYFNLIAIAATITLCFGAVAVYHPNTASQQSYIETVSRNVSTIMRVGLGDHLHCAVLRRRATPTAGVVIDLPRRFQPILKIARQRVPPQFNLLSAHECKFQSRQFVHLTFGNSRGLLSLVIARKQDDESLAGGSGRVSAAEFRAAAFESRDYLVYAVSDLPERQNTEVLAALQIPLKTFLDQMGV